MTRKAKIELLLKESYLAMIKNSVASNLFRNLYAKVAGRKKDVLENGQLSCAVFVSAVLFLNHLIKDNHATVIITLKDMKKSGWYKIKKPKIGSVIVWEKKKFKDGNFHTHIGFFMGKNKAISNSRTFGQPRYHHYTYHNKRKIESIWWHKKLESSY